MNDPFCRHAIRTDLELLQQAADEHQAQLNYVGAHAVPVGSAGQLLRLGRASDTLERCCTELAQLLDHPPRLDRSGTVRLLPRPERSHDCAA